ncbi:hypothetical protein [Actinomadura sp. NTSP31]|uniref:hypothetical protein n=1 Tax=Actinomadura sp. NTSP31 TaxID=1735447 RepID=UPI0035C251E0
MSRNEHGLPVGVTYNQARDRRHLAMCAYGTRAVAVLRALAEGRPPDADGALDGEDVARDPLTGEHLLPDEHQVAIPEGLLTARPCRYCDGTGTTRERRRPDGRVWMQSGPCPSCDARGTKQRGPEPLERAWNGFSHVLTAHQEYDDAFGRDDTFDCGCAETNPDGRCTCDPAHAEYLICAGQAACLYSLRIPPRRWRLRTSRRAIRSGSVIGGGSG